MAGQQSPALSMDELMVDVVEHEHRTPRDPAPPLRLADRIAKMAATKEGPQFGQEEGLAPRRAAFDRGAAALEAPPAEESAPAEPTEAERAEALGELSVVLKPVADRMSVYSGISG